MNTYTKNVLKILKNHKSNTVCASSISKISLKSNNSFSLPAGPKLSCPGATKACEGCYAMKGRHHFSNVQKKFASNWVALRKLEKNNSTKSTNKAVDILEALIPKSAKVFRIHESGDFHSQWMINVWSRVIQRRPDVKFWAYTRSFHLNFAPLTKRPNFTLWASTDEYNTKAAKKFVRRFRKSGVKHAYGPWKHDSPIPENSVICPVTSKKIKINGACEKCMLCVVKKRINKNIVFLEH